MDTVTQSNTVVNPLPEDGALFIKVIEHIEQINSLRDSALNAILNIKDPTLRKIASFTFEMPHESATKF